MIFVYKTTNMVNQKYYIGVHKTKNQNDSYLGSGKRLADAIKHYGKECFRREIISIHNDYMSALEEERSLVSKVLGDSNCYNLCDGGGMPPKYDGKNHPMFGKKRPNIAKRMKAHNPAKLKHVRDQHRNTVIVKDKNGNIFKIKKDHPDWMNGIVVCVNKGKIQAKVTCLKCRRIFGTSNFSKHNNACKYMEGSV